MPLATLLATLLATPCAAETRSVILKRLDSPPANGPSGRGEIEMAVADRAEAPPRAVLNAEEFFRLGDAEGKQELVRGEVVTMAPAGGGHGELQLGLGSELRAHARQQGLGFVVTEVGFRLATQPDTVRAPDIAFIVAERFPGGRLPDGFIEGPPDLAVEVISPGDTYAEVDEKVQEYLAAGSHLVWAVNPRTRSVRVYRQDGSSHVLRGDEMLSGEDVLPGFSLRVGDLLT